MRSPWAWLAALAHVALATGYLLATPVAEAPDEPGHFLYARHLLEREALPLIPGSARRLDRPLADESPMAHHPPLYYALLAGTQLALGAEDLTLCLRKAFAPDEERTLLLWAHGHDEAAPVSREVAVFRALRAWSVLLGAVAVLLTHRLGRALFPERPGVADAGALLLACLPQWSFVHGVLDNGNLATALCTGVFLVLARAWQRGLTAGRGAALGLLVGLALLAKLTTLFLVPLAAGVGLAALARPREPGRSRRAVLASLLLAAAVAGAVAAPFFLRNAALYGDPLALSAHELAYAGSRLAPQRVGWYFANRFPRETFRSFVAAFGWGGLEAPEPLYAAVKVLGVLALAGLVARLASGRGRGERAGLLLLGAIVVLVLAGLVRFNLSFRQPQGRYLFPAAGPLALLVAAGLAPWARLLGSARRVLTPLLGLGTVALAAALLVLHARPALAPPAADPARADPHAAILVLDLSRAADPARRTLRVLGPPEGARLREPPLVRWEPAPPGALHSLHVSNRSGRLLGAAFEQGGLRLEGGAFTLPAEIWRGFPPGEELVWKVRRVPDRSRGEAVRSAPESAPRTFVRVE